jgi:hypothetical protein
MGMLNGNQKANVDVGIIFQHGLKKDEIYGAIT